MTYRGFDPLERDLVAAAKRCATASVAGAPEADRAGTFPEAAYRAAAEAGLVGLAVPQTYGGHGVSAAAQVAMVREGMQMVRFVEAPQGGELLRVHAGE